MSTKFPTFKELRVDAIPVVVGVALAGLCPPATIAPLLMKHLRQLRGPRLAGSYYSQFRALLDPPGRMLHIIIGTRRTNDQWTTVCALASEWTAATGEAPPPWPAS
jgi:hypothetical protein